MNGETRNGDGVTPSWAPVTIGENVAVIGSPFGLEGSLTAGVVNSLREFSQILAYQTTAPDAAALEHMDGIASFRAVGWPFASSPEPQILGSSGKFRHRKLVGRKDEEPSLSRAVQAFTAAGSGRGGTGSFAFGISLPTSL